MQTSKKQRVVGERQGGTSGGGTTPDQILVHVEQIKALLASYYEKTASSSSSTTPSTAASTTPKNQLVLKERTPAPLPDTTGKVEKERYRKARDEYTKITGRDPITSRPKQEKNESVDNYMFRMTVFYETCVRFELARKQYIEKFGEAEYKAKKPKNTENLPPAQFCEVLTAWLEKKCKKATF